MGVIVLLVSCPRGSCPRAIEVYIYINTYVTQHL